MALILELVHCVYWAQVVALLLICAVVVGAVMLRHQHANEDGMMSVM